MIPLVGTSSKTATKKKSGTRNKTKTKAPQTKAAAKPKTKAKPPPDPLAALRAAKPHSKAVKGLPFEGGEHAWLGTAGTSIAVLELRTAGIDVDPETFTHIRRQNGRDDFTYGELVALSGDFYESPKELYEEKAAAIPWLWEDNDTRDIRAMFAEELKWIDDRQRARPAAAYPDNNIRFAWNAKAYLELAMRNVVHFGWHNIVAYCTHHTEALRLAKKAAGKTGDDWSRALVTNAFADHFLTDGFAAGHVRVPRQEIIDWSNANGFDDKLSGALSKVLHDQDGHVDSMHGTGALSDGLAVVNSRGDRWRTFCDGQLFLFPGATALPHVQHPSRAVAESVKELARAWKRGELPAGQFAALDRVPFPDPTAPGLAQKFQAITGPKLDALMASIAWYTKLGAALKRSHVEQLFSALPELMARFRKAVAEAAKNETLKSRLPPAYVDAYSSLT